MSDNTNIEWTDRTWNVVTGCDRVSPGCDNCYAMTMAKRLKGMGAEKYQRDGDPRTSGPGFGVSVHPGTLADPLKWRKPQRVFVNSMSDLFHDQVDDDYIANVFAVMARAGHHTFQLLTKRHARMRSLLNSDLFRRLMYDYLVSLDYAWIRDTPLTWPLPNVWLGVSAENQQWADIRIPALLDTPAAVRFISAEPLLGPIDLRQSFAKWVPPIDHNAWETADRERVPGGVTDTMRVRDVLHWVITGGESGPGARPMHPNWARGLRDQCTSASVPFFYKQTGEWAPAPWHGPDGATHAFTGGLYQDDRGAWVQNFMALGHNPMSLERDLTTPPGAQGMRRVGKKAAGRELDGHAWDEFPVVAGA